jgi:hypothetical protein
MLQNHETTTMIGSLPFESLHLNDSELASYFAKDLQRAQIKMNQRKQGGTLILAPLQQTQDTFLLSAGAQQIKHA